jgi:hypothetical protein
MTELFAILRKRQKKPNRFPTADLTEGTEKYYENYSVLVPVCTTAAVLSLHNYFATIYGCDSNPHYRIS